LEFAGAVVTSPLVPRDEFGPLRNHEHLDPVAAPFVQGDPFGLRQQPCAETSALATRPDRKRAEVRTLLIDVFDRTTRDQFPRVVGDDQSLGVIDGDEHARLRRGDGLGDRLAVGALAPEERGFRRPPISAAFAAIGGLDQRDDRSDVAVVGGPQHRGTGRWRRHSPILRPNRRAGSRAGPAHVPNP